VKDRQTRYSKVERVEIWRHEPNGDLTLMAVRKSSYPVTRIAAWRYGARARDPKPEGKS